MADSLSVQNALATGLLKFAGISRFYEGSRFIPINPVQPIHERAIHERTIGVSQLTSNVSRFAGPVCNPSAAQLQMR